MSANFRSFVKDVVELWPDETLIIVVPQLHPGVKDDVLADIFTLVKDFGSVRPSGMVALPGQDPDVALSWSKLQMREADSALHFATVENLMVPGEEVLATASVLFNKHIWLFPHPTTGAWPFHRELSFDSNVFTYEELEDGSVTMREVFAVKRNLTFELDFGKWSESHRLQVVMGMESFSLVTVNVTLGPCP